jgi:hypothetical protein
MGGFATSAPRRLGVCLAVSTLALLATPLAAPLAAAAQPVNYIYLATTHDPALKQGDVRAGSINWKCVGNTCKVKGPWDKPSIQACAKLAREVGPIRRYGRDLEMLSRADLERCNRDATAIAVGPIGVAVGTAESSKDAMARSTGNRATMGVGISDKIDPRKPKEDPADAPGYDISMPDLRVLGFQPALRYGIALRNERDNIWNLGGFVDLVLYQGTPEAGLTWVNSKSMSIPPLSQPHTTQMLGDLGSIPLRDGVWYTLRASLRNTPADGDRSNDCFEQRWYMVGTRATSVDQGRFDCRMRLDIARP